jgi:hypothetical protein
MRDIAKEMQNHYELMARLHQRVTIESMRIALGISYRMALYYAARLKIPFNKRKNRIKDAYRAAAKRCAQKDKYGVVSLWELARELECSTSAVHRYFTYNRSLQKELNILREEEANRLRFRLAVATLRGRQPGIAITYKVLAREMCRASGGIWLYFNRHPELARELGIAKVDRREMAKPEIEATKDQYRNAVRTLQVTKSLQNITAKDIACELGKKTNTVWTYLGKNPDLLKELRIKYHPKARKKNELEVVEAGA